ncbi:MAG: trypsin-like serine protease [Hyphomicrobiaceae bacterium]|nr:trypsin-like serine protease [Hyphomicrobiaceae bacterium]
MASEVCGPPGVGRIARLSLLLSMLLFVMTGVSNSAAGQEPALAASRQRLVQEATDRLRRDQQPLPAFMQAYQEAAPSGEIGGLVVGASSRKVHAGFFRESIGLFFPGSEGPSIFRCSGVLIAEAAALTAAHCICNLGLGGLLVGRGPELRAFVGEEFRSGADTHVPVRSAVLLDPEFCRRPRPGMDLALLKLDPTITRARLKPEQPRPARFDRADEYAPALVAPPEVVLSSSVRALYVVGFGINNEGRADSKNLAVVPILSRICGSELSRAYFDCAAGREIVLAGVAGDTCQGDSGGGAFAVAGGSYYLVGITSRGLQQRCGPGGIYTLITPAVVNWIRKNGVEPPDMPRHARHQN